MISCEELCQQKWEEGQELVCGSNILDTTNAESSLELEVPTGHTTLRL